MMWWLYYQWWLFSFILVDYHHRYCFFLKLGRYRLATYLQLWSSGNDVFNSSHTPYYPLSIRAVTSIYKALFVLFLLVKLLWVLWWPSYITPMRKASCTRGLNLYKQAYLTTQPIVLPTLITEFKYKWNDKSISRLKQEEKQEHTQEVDRLSSFFTDVLIKRCRDQR